MRVLLTAVRYPPAPGGAETHVHALATGLQARGHDVRVVTSDLAQEVPFRRDPSLPTVVDGIPVTRLPAWSPGGEAHYVFIRRILRELTREASRADVLHAHSYGYHQTWAAALASKLTSTPFVFTPHFHPPWSMEGGPRRSALRTIYDRTLGPFTLRSADAILGVSEAEMALLEPLSLPRDRVRIVGNGIHLERFTGPNDAAGFRDRVGASGPLILYAGRLASNKGLLHLVRALPAIVEAHPDAVVALVGADQDQGAALRREAESLGVAQSLRFVGHVDEAILTAAFHAADVFVLPSEYEAFGIVLLEAMACGTPVVAARRGGMPEVLDGGRAGILVDHGDPAGLGAAVNRLLADPALARELGEEGRAHVGARFTWDAVVDRVEAAYHDVTSA